MLCVKCKRNYDEDDMRSVDGQKVCIKCLFGDVQPFRVWPIGFVNNDKVRRVKGFGTTGSNISKIVLSPNMVQFIKGLSEESHLTIVWYIHQGRPIKTRFKRGWDGKEVGMFASRTPDRLNHIGITDVELLGIEGNVLTVKGFDAVNGTPVLDIKVSIKSLNGRT